MQQRSIFQVIERFGLPREYAHVLAVSGASELWTSQMTAIDAGLLQSDAPFVINLPTGAGKSLLAEMAILNRLANEPGAWGLYLVPSRVLVHQVDADLRRRLPLFGVRIRTVIAGVEPAGILDDELSDIAKPKTITVLTPEKLDIYFRNNPELFAFCRILVVDEAHKIGDRSRGSVIDSLITRFSFELPVRGFSFFQQ